MVNYIRLYNIRTLALIFIFVRNVGKSTLLPLCKSQNNFKKFANKADRVNFEGTVTNSLYKINSLTGSLA